ncbi:hypothetical protein TSAR_014612 [Trichomalopsis sarcophagae]|uniref:Uncharacterized protein n=1 Tax=Trichomalopsis sarcophagae TaxID=543379 RepID=A0A232FDU4_9HYME|nr:hypothetical protein TSAR_014612 [Trichomalopsis sarcophagae]
MQRDGVKKDFGTEKVTIFGTSLPLFSLGRSYTIHAASQLLALIYFYAFSNRNVHLVVIIHARRAAVAAARLRHFLSCVYALFAPASVCSRLRVKDILHLIHGGEGGGDEEEEGGSCYRAITICQRTFSFRRSRFA